MPAVVPLPQPGPPKFITLEEHKQLTASTPSSFGDIPPILQRKKRTALAFVWPSGTGFTIEYPRITLHAVSRGESGPSVYCQLDESAEGLCAPGGDEEQVDSEMREMKIIPSNPESVIEPIFEALSQCAALHPDPNDGGEDDGWVDEGDGGFDTFDGTNEEELSEVGRVRNDFSTPSARFQPY
ncbi:volume decrease after cellular swelling [Rhizoctonia solani]|uniref:Volume decrease after cellular swelling n=1 Tax=Rhizoctonia solani TaxID=456999 RepID=A0A8H7I8F9_9AGAM|nr:volume decrease after cellular swelling [Rhizoctonia solani]